MRKYATRPSNIEIARILRKARLRHAGPDQSKHHGPGEGPCPVCEDHGMTFESGGIKYCLCPTGREKKREWLSFPARDRAPIEAVYPTVPDAEDIQEERQA